MKFKISYIMVEMGTGGYWGDPIIRGVYTEDEWRAGKHKELIKDKPARKGMEWQYKVDRVEE